ncbi:hypothetical protein ACE6H2_017640 [Prunus campanulata]
MSSESANENCLGYAARDPSGVLSEYKFSRRCLGIDDISIKITHCGVCYADVIWARNKHGDSKYPLVPGHEIAGIVKEVGSNVHRFKVGDHIGVGTYVNSCRDCEYCNEGLEVHCVKGSVYTFNGVDADGTITKGGYSSHIVVHERYCFKIPDNYPLASAAPLLCAGITVYAPMKRHKMNQPGKSVGVIGLGGLGHMAVKFGKAFGLHVTVFSTSVSKKEEALSQLGADKFVVSSDLEQMTALVKSLDFLIDTASGDHPFDPYMALLKTGGTLVLVGFPTEVKFSPASLNLGMKTISGSLTGGTKDTQEMIDFCAAHEIHPMIEIIPIQYATEALERLVKKDVKYRALGTDDVSIKITHCGVCYADVSRSRNQHGDSKYPVVPGHKIAGIVKEVGSNVQRFKVGDHMSTHAEIALVKSLDFIIDTASGDHPFDPYMELLKTGGVLVLVGFPSEVKISPALPTLISVCWHVSND